MAADSTEDLQPGTATSLGAAERRLLPTMPLHAITSVHGQAGLRERLLLEIARFPVTDRAPPRTRWRWLPACTSTTGGSVSRT